MMQGDSYGLKIEILKDSTDSDGNPVDEAVTPDEVSDVEITVGFFRKTYANGEVLYIDGYWIFPISQEESFKLPATRVKAQVRVAWKVGSIEGVSLGDIRVHESIRKVVL
jgi:hypothetical protein